jgi:hypothetical protein
LVLAAFASFFPKPVFLVRAATKPYRQNKDLIRRRQLAKMIRIESTFVTASESDQGGSFPFQKVRLHET